MIKEMPLGKRKRVTRLGALGTGWRVGNAASVLAAVASRKRRRARFAKPKRFSLNVHNFSRYCLASTFEYNADGQAVDFEFKFTDIINNTEFSSLFDQFKITKVVMKFQMINNPDAIASELPGGNTFNKVNWYPKLWYIRDTDGGSSETLSSIKERQGAKYMVMRPNKVHNIVVRPCVAVQTYKTLTTTGYGPKRMFLDMAGGTTVPHYGVKTVLDTLGIDPNDTYPFKIRYEAKYYFTCKDVR